MEQCVFHLAYLGPGGPEFLLVMLVLLVLFGAKDAPRILRKLNEIINQVRNTADGFKREVMYGDLNADPPIYDATDVEEEHDGDYEYDEDHLYDGGEAVDELSPEDINQEAETDASEESGEDDVRQT